MVSVFLAVTKTKVAPLQSVSIPCLELMGAHLGSKLAHSIANVPSIPKKHIIFWSDSTDVLLWIRGYSRVLNHLELERLRCIVVDKRVNHLELERLDIIF